LFALWEIPLSVEIRIPPEQPTAKTKLSPEHPPPKSSRTLLEEPPFVVLSSGATSPPAFSYHHSGANCSVGNPSPRGNPGLKCIRTDAILKNSIEKGILDFKKYVQRDCRTLGSI
jgi:hypothetical protein